MAISGFGNTPNNLKSGLVNKTLTLKGAAELKPIELKPEPEQPDVKPNAVWICDIDNEKRLGFGHTEPGDVIIMEETGEAYRHCIDADGNNYWALTTVKSSDFESDRGDLRRK